jgi:hypothetical protein
MIEAPTPLDVDDIDPRSSATGASYLGEMRLSLGEPTWKTLDRETVEMLVGQQVRTRYLRSMNSMR